MNYEYKVKVGKQLDNLILLICVVGVMIVVLATPCSPPVKILSVTFVIIFGTFSLLIVLHDFKVLMSIIVKEDSISLKRFLKPTITILFPDVRRVLIKEGYNSSDGSRYFTLIIDGEVDKIKTVISDLRDVRGFIQLLEQKVVRHQLKMVKQNIEGQIVDDLFVY